MGRAQQNQSEEDETVFPENYLTATSFDTFFEEQSNLPSDYLDAVSSTSLKETKFLNNKEVGIVEAYVNLALKPNSSSNQNSGCPPFHLFNLSWCKNKEKKATLKMY